MKRLALKLLLFLLLGAIVNVAVAWYFSWNSYVRDQDVDAPNDSDIKWWQRTAPEGVADVPARVIRSSGTGFDGTYMFEQLRTEASPTSGHTCSHHMLGWPMRSIEFTRWQLGPRIVGHRGVLVIPEFWRPGTNTVVFLPIKPRAFGAIVNSALYGSILYIAGTGISAFRRRRRIRKGLCPQCKYPIGASDTCTECGGPVR